MAVKQGLYGVYPLVNCYITMENHQRGKTDYKWKFSISISNYQRVPLGKCWTSEEPLGKSWKIETCCLNHWETIGKMMDNDLLDGG